MERSMFGDWDFGGLRVRAEKEIQSSGRTEKALSEYEKYMKLVYLYPGRQLAMAGIVDEVWHLHILDTLNYTSFCDRYFGSYIHHNPNVEDQTGGHHLAYTQMLDLMKQHFGYIDLNIWPSADDVKNQCSGCNKCYRQIVGDITPDYEIF